MNAIERRDMLRAHSEVRQAIKRGALVRQPCEECGSTVRVAGHHPRGYTNGHELDVQWLCRPHHAGAHLEQGLLMFVPITDAAKTLGVAPSTLRHQIRLGRFHARKIGRAWYVTPEEVERYRRDVQGKAA